jgi:hypothetical protein
MVSRQQHSRHASTGEKRGPAKTSLQGVLIWDNSFSAASFFEANQPVAAVKRFPFLHAVFLAVKFLPHYELQNLPTRRLPFTIAYARH